MGAFCLRIIWDSDYDATERLLHFLAEILRIAKPADEDFLLFHVSSKADNRGDRH